MTYIQEMIQKEAAALMVLPLKYARVPQPWSSLQIAPQPISGFVKAPGMHGHGIRPLMDKTDLQRTVQTL